MTRRCRSSPSSSPCGLEGEALIGGYVASAALTAALASVYARPARPGWCRPELGEIAHYGLPAAGSSMLHTVTRNADYVILAARLAPAQVGYYLRAFQLGSEYQAKISGILLRVALPVLSRATDLDEVRRIRARIVRTHASVLFPLLFGLIALAPLFVPLVYGPLGAGGRADPDPRHRGTRRRAGDGHRAAAARHRPPARAARLQPPVRGRLRRGGPDRAADGPDRGLLGGVDRHRGPFLVLQYAIVDRIVGIPLLETLRDALPALVAGLPAPGPPLLHRLARRSRTARARARGRGRAGRLRALLRLLFPSAWSDLAPRAGGLRPG